MTGVINFKKISNHITSHRPPNIQLGFRDFPDPDGRVTDDHGPPGSAQVVQFLDLRGFEGDVVDFNV